MKTEISTLLWKNAIILFIITVGVGILLFPTVDNIFLLISLLFVLYIVFMLWIGAFVMKYVKPVEKTIRTMEKILEGNFRARVHDGSGGEIGLLNKHVNSLARNLSKLKMQEQMQAEQLRTVIENTESGLILIDEKGYIHIVNRKFLAMFGQQASDFVGRLFYDVIPIKEMQHVVQETFLHESYTKERFAIQSAAGQGKLYVEVVGAPIFDELNLLKGAVLAIYDISEFKRLERMRKDFVANVSHELKTPITSIRGFAETLISDQGMDDESKLKFLSIIHEESERIHHLIDDLLTLSELERDTLVLEKDVFDVTQLLKDASRMMELQANEKGIQLEEDIPNEPCLIHADGQRLKQVVLNILSNAINYTPAGGKVSLTFKAEADHVSFSIIDSGIGILEKDIPRLFERFYRVDRARSRDTGGTGLGLAIVKHILEAHDGRVTVESKVGKGTRFTIYLPRE